MLIKIEVYNIYQPIPTPTTVNTLRIINLVN